MKTETTNSRRVDILRTSLMSDQEIFSSVLKRWQQRFGYWSVFAAVPAVLISQLHVTPAVDGKQSEVQITGLDARPTRKLSVNESTRSLLKRQSQFRLPSQNDDGRLTPLGGPDDCPGQAIPAGTYTAAAPYTEVNDTTGANNTVNAFYCYSCFYLTVGSPGPDHVYSFILTDRGANPKIEISTTSSTFSPVIYLLEGGFPEACTGDKDGFAWNGLIFSDSANGVATINSFWMNWLPLNVPLYLFIDSRVQNSAGSYTLKMQDVTIAPPVTNAIDHPGFFVRQHYFDFLSREPDVGGLTYWTNRITECGADSRCIHDRRIGVSAAFFVEMEFQDTGYYVYRFYKASFGRQPTYEEFASDRYRVVGGSNLETRKQAFADGWVQRPAFLAAYPITLSNTEVVNKLFDSAGLTNSIYDSQRQQEIAAMNAGRSRALVLRDVIEISDFKNPPNPNDPRYAEIKQVSQYNPAFVLMQYFGYLRRNVDQNGYDFWVDVLNNREPNNYRGMVCSFITSTEYQRRFGSVVTRSNADCAL